MITPTPAALAAAEEIKKHFEGERIVVNSWDELSVDFLDSIAAIIDRHTSKAVSSRIRFFKDETGDWFWRDGTMYIGDIGSAAMKSIFMSPEELLSQSGVYETDEHGRKLAVEPCSCGNWEIIRKNNP